MVLLRLEAGDIAVMVELSLFVSQSEVEMSLLVGVLEVGLS